MSPTRSALIALLCLALSSCSTRVAKVQVDKVAGPAEATVERPSSTFQDTTTVNRDALVAAVRFVCSGQELLDTPPAQLPDEIRSIWSSTAADRAVDSTIEELVALRERLGPGRGPTRYRQSVLAIRVESSTPTRVEVSIWWVGVLSRDGAVVPQAQWTTSRITVIAENGQWRVDAEASEPGPVPDSTSDSEPISHDEFERRLAGFADWEPVG